MKKAFLVALVTALVFAAGFWTRVWTDRHRPLPPPPGAFGAEFSHQHPPGMMGEARHERPLSRAELIAKVEQLRPQLEAFRTKMGEIDAEFDKQLDQVLTPEQRAKRADFASRRAREDRPEPKEGKKPLSDDQLGFMLRDQPARTVLWDVVIPLRLDVLTRVFKLDDAQRQKVQLLLKERRDKFLQLIDSSPPPSVTLSRLAPMIQRIAEPPPPPPDRK